MWHLCILGSQAVKTHNKNVIKHSCFHKSVRIGIQLFVLTIFGSFFLGRVSGKRAQLSSDGQIENKIFFGISFFN